MKPSRMITWRARYFVWVLSALLVNLVGAGIPHSTAQTSTCEGVPIELARGAPETLEVVCTAARQAIQILASCGIEALSTVKVETVDEPQSHCGVPVYGTFDPSTSTIRLASLSLCIAQFPAGSAHAALPPRNAYQSIVVHEMTHAFLSGRTKSRPLPRVAQEYVAYVVQISSMNENDQSRFLSAFSGQPIAELWHFNELSYFLNPEQFAVLAFEHFRHPSNGCGFLQRVVSGEVNFPDSNFSP